jgi:nucleotidyltransferase substrate binding protein (TIGR01987 family)
MSDGDIRWKQRFQQFRKAFVLLQQAIGIDEPSVVERAGLIQFFEMAFELGWKLLKDYQEAEGYTIASPRDAIKQAYQAGLVLAGHDWIDALEDRNLTTHTYNEQTAVEVEQKIRHTYYPLLLDLQRSFAERVVADDP